MRDEETWFVEKQPGFITVEIPEFILHDSIFAINQAILKSQ